MDTLKKTYDSHLCLDGSCVAKVKPKERFHILVANFGTNSKLLLLKQNIAKASSHQTTFIESHMSRSDLLGVILEDKGNERNLYRKGDFNPRDVELINRHLDDDCEKQMGEDKKTVTAGDIAHDFDKNYVT